MIGLIALIAYSLVGTFIARRLAWVIYNDMQSPYLTGVGGLDWGAFAFALVGGVIGGAIWPLSAGFLGARSLIDRHGADALLAAFMAMPRNERQRQRVQRLENEAKAREAYIAKLEREVGVGGNGQR